tara:strand:+ start:248 stop:514 length:267 start_codon:yes stop_codon:yes gene_type:complete
MTWKNDLMRIIKRNHLDLGIFTIEELYRVSFNILSRRYPNNNTIKASIQSNLQKLRDDGYLIFISRGVYKVNSSCNDEFIHFVSNYHK